MKYLTEEDCYIKSDYLTPVQHDHSISQKITLNIYKMFNSRNQQKGLSYYTTLFGYCSACNITLDSSTEARLSASITLILADEIKDDLLIQPEKLIWFDTAIQIVKEYRQINVQTGDEIVKEVNFGYILPNQDTITYNADTRELSISGADVITTLSEVRGGHLRDKAGNTEELLGGSGLLLMGSESDYVRDIRYQNFYIDAIEQGIPKNEISLMWQDNYEEMSKYYESNTSQFPQQSEVYNNVGMHTIYELVDDIWFRFQAGMMHWKPYVRLWNQEHALPKDLEFDGTATLLDVYKAIVDLYPNQCIYFDNNLRLTLEELPSSHYDKFQDCRMFSNELMDIVLSETVNYNFDNVVNAVVVFGKDNSCSGMYEVRTGWHCIGCNKTYTYPQSSCPNCGSFVIFSGEENELSVDRIGVHQKIINCDTYYTDKECEDAAKAECLMANKFAETITVVVADVWLSCYQMSNLGVGRKIEYTSIATGETNVYTLDKLSIDQANGEATLELSRFYPIRTIVSPRDILDFRHGNYATLVEPKIEGYELSDTGLLTIYISNGVQGKFSLYKIYMEDNWDNSRGEYTYGVVTRNRFIGQTCTELPEEERIAKGFAWDTKVFTYQLHTDGIYKFRVKAYNPNFKDSQYSSTWYGNPLEVKVEIFGNHLMADGYNPLLLEDDTYLYV